LVPTAFTPNADGLNDELRISNAPVIDQLIAFEIYDRWGNRVFVTDDLNGTWDGSYGGSPLNPGTYLWRVNYWCNGRENVTMGEVTLLR
jgi:gliding motility-associated-like protein